MDFTDLFMIKNNKITSHVYLDEYKCHHCSKLPKIKDNHHYSAILYLFSVFEIVRSHYGKPIKITSGYRCQEYQEILRQQGYKTAKISPHTFGVALDILVEDKDELFWIYNFLVSHFPNLRIGYHKYNHQFIHFDTAYLLNPIHIPEFAKPYWVAGARW